MGYYRTPPLRPYGAGGFGGVPQVTPANRVLMIACGVVWGVQLLLRLAVARQEQEAIDRALAERQNLPVILGLVGYLRSCWDVAQMAKHPIEQEMLRAMRQRNGEYEADKLKAIRDQGGSEVYMMITEVKCRAAESWLRDILLDSGSPPWDLQATPIPDLSPSQTQEIQGAFAEKVIQIVQQTGQAPTKADMAELREMVAQDYRFKILQEAQGRADRMKVGETKGSAVREIEALVKSEDAKVFVLNYEETAYTGRRYGMEKYYPTWKWPEDHAAVQAGARTYQTLFGRPPRADARGGDDFLEPLLHEGYSSISVISLIVGSSERSFRSKTSRNRFVEPYMMGLPGTFFRPTIWTSFFSRSPLSDPLTSTPRIFSISCLVTG